jgi:hypothetical protein
MSVSKSVSKIETDSPKKFIVMKQDLGVLYRVGLEGGGVVPDILSGRYTSIKAAEYDIEKYLVQRG